MRVADKNVKRAVEAGILTAACHAARGIVGGACAPQRSGSFRIECAVTERVACADRQRSAACAGARRSAAQRIVAPCVGLSGRAARTAAKVAAVDRQEVAQVFPEVSSVQDGDRQDCFLGIVRW